MSTPPGVAELIWTEQVPPVVVQVLPPTNAAPAVLFSRLKVTRVPSGAGPKPVDASPPGAPEASWSFWLTVAVIVWAWPTGFVAVSGDRTIRHAGLTLAYVHAMVSPASRPRAAIPVAVLVVVSAPPPVQVRSVRGQPAIGRPGSVTVEAPGARVLEGRLLGCVGSLSSSRMKLPIVVVWSLVEVKLKSRALFGTASWTIVIEPAT